MARTNFDSLTLSVGGCCKIALLCLMTGSPSLHGMFVVRFFSAAQDILLVRPLVRALGISSHNASNTFWGGLSTAVGTTLTNQTPLLQQQINGVLNTTTQNLQTNMNQIAEGFEGNLEQTTEFLQGQLQKNVNFIQTTAENKLPEFRQLFVNNVTQALKDIRPRLVYLGASFAGALVGSGGAAVLGTWVIYRGIKYFIDPKIAILLPGSVVNLTDRLRRWSFGYAHPVAIYSADVDKKLSAIVQSTNDIHAGIQKGEKGLTFDNIILSGPSGTGKTMWLDEFAAKTKMRIAKVTAGSLAQLGAGVAALDQLIKMADKDPLIIAIDEFDSLGRDRGSIRGGSDHEKLFNHFLSLTGARSSKFIIVVTTNRAHSLDPTMIRRFQHHVEVGLPDESARLRQMKLFCQELILSNKSRGKNFIKTAQEVLNENTLHEFVYEARELSGAEIRDVISSAYKKTLAKGVNVFTKGHLTEALQECISKKRALSSNP